MTNHFPATVAPDQVTRKRRVHSLNDVASTLGVSRQTVYNLHKRGKIRISKILGKSVVFDEDLEAFIESSKERVR